ncbi:threonine--tRNA ligase [Paenibacillus sp. FSL R7-0048]|jgi:threonyl-tRNA synthetase|uniref:threonine--tRNA ligase n=1 Tax=Paenibacillus TaxID=44249 RepID=UPI00096F873A|nr:threonine--tRNA ligase [Paenibacillus odorifer]OMC73732.1 threonine--tRNA ligase [Paenibacillus odorifer]OMC74973.1 threonine--tRNA ligase [Paenibacillus odorifer]OMD78723.1 threonine--tRNA ligase [Paenibacillus odorifer]OMD93155.1 threonine--tRNA ligase [Paenibacillus odorifer]OMD95226.1 threonine--tRNA ligase [Paenibacillus odorifer]
MKIKVTLQDGTIREVLQGTTIKEAAGAISTSLKKNAVAGKIDGKSVDLNQAIEHDCRLDIVTLDSKDGLEVYRHSTAHIMAQAIKRIYGDKAVQLGIGPVIEDGFYYDIDIEKPLSTDDLAAIEQEMAKIIQENHQIVRRVVSRAEAIKLFEELNEPLKLELIHDLPEDTVLTIYDQGEFSDLCRGPHLPSTGLVKAFKLLNVAGAYWRGDSNNKMLQRIYGTAFPKKAQLEEHLLFLEEAKKRDHRKLGKELELFMFSEEAPGMPFYLPKGMTIRTELENFARELQRQRDYDEVRTPLMMNNRLWEQSGHWDHYKDNMYFTDVDETKFALKPMNCPGHMLIFKNNLHSYRELPIRISEFGQVHRHEYSGALNGMMRVRTFCQDDAHLFVLPEQIEDEIRRVISLIDHIYQVFGFEYKIELSTRPADYMGSEELWDQAEQSLQNVLDNLGIEYRVNEGDGAFYGPKIDFHILDALKRSWQCGTIQLDWQMPEKFDLTYIGEDNLKHRPVVIHRAVYGSIDRFMGIITEHFAGAFPLWLAPVHAKLLPVSENYVDYALQVKHHMEKAGIRVEVDIRNEKLGYKIREAQLEKAPYMLVLGENEKNSDTVSVRKRGEGDLGSKSIQDIIEQINEEIISKR